MAKEPKESSTIDIESAFDKTEQYIDQNKKSLLLIVGGVVLLVAIFFGWKYFYLKPRTEESANKMFKAEMAFAKDSFNIAIKGNKDVTGFSEIADDYGMTSTGNLAKYYLGVSDMHAGKWDDAIEALGGFDSDDKFLGAMALGLIGDAYSEKNQTDDAIEYYLKAAKKNANKLTTPVFLKKAAYLYEDKGNKAEALKLYQQIKTDYPESQEATQADKYIARTGGIVK